MKEELLKYALQFTDLSDEEKQAVMDEIPIETFKKGTILLREGEISTTCFFILKGCVRKYSVIDGEEKTTAFYTENEAVVSFNSYTQQVPADHYFICMEDTTTVVGYREREAEMYIRFPKFESLSRMFMSQDLGKAQEEMAVFITSTAEERYLHLLQNRPDLLQRVPQHQIASYLGITPESLSRIRKRMTTGK